MPKINILHFSDFHLDANHEKDAKRILEKMISCINDADNSIDLIIFSGDMINQGGRNYPNIDEAFKRFKVLVIDNLVKAFNLSSDRFILTFGNHDSKITEDDLLLDEGIDNKFTSEIEVKNFVDSKKSKLYLNRQASARSFRDNYYKAVLDNERYKPTDFQSNYKIEINGIKVGITSLNTSWRCAYDDRERLVLGLWQISDSEPFIKDCDLKIAVGHHHPNLMKEFERNAFSRDLSRVYDVYFCGHTHSPYVELRKPLGWLMDITSAGALSANIYVERDTYKNGFQIVEIDTDKHDYSIFTFTAQDFFDFKLAEKRTEHIPQPDENSKIIRKAEERAKDAELRLQQLSYDINIAPFTTIEKFIASFETTYKFISNPKIDDIINNLRNNKNELRILAQSGMGKTRIIWEAFKDNKSPNVFYTSSVVEENTVKSLLTSHKDEEGILILDNCTLQNLYEVEDYVRKWNHLFRIISVNNDLSENKDKINGKVIKLDYTETEDIVDKYLSEDEYLSKLENRENVTKLIKEYSGNIPYMAFLLTDTYRQYGIVKLKNANDVLNRLLGSPSNDEQKALASIAIFKLLGFKGEAKKEYNIVKNDIDIHHIHDVKGQELNYLFSQTIENYKRRRLIEELTYWINVRPQPLAEWLVSSWFENTNSESLLNMFDHISKNADRGNLLIEFCKRIEEMGESEREKDIMRKALLPKYGPFCNESVAVSTEGSRLMLSMANVNPEAVAECLYYLFNNKSTIYLRNNIVDSTRWNINQALQKCCIKKDNFEKAAIILARLAVAENETYSNGAKGTFLQLFHLALSATQSTPSQRIDVLKCLESQSNEFFTLIVDAISSALSTEHVMVDGTANIIGGRRYEDYEFKTYDDIHGYWSQCISILIDMLNMDPSLIQYTLQKMSGHVKDFVNMHAIPLLSDMLSSISPLIDNRWKDMRDNIHYILESKKKFPLTKEDIAVLSNWEEKLTLKDFMSRAHDTFKFRASGMYNVPIEKSFEYTCKLMEPFAEEFVNEKLYKSEVLPQLLEDKEPLGLMFYKALAEQITKKELGNDFVNIILQYVKSKEKSYTSSVLLSICNNAFKEDWVKELKIELYTSGYYKLAVALYGLTSDESISGFKKVLDDVDNSLYPCELINSFLSFFHYNTPQNISTILDNLKERKAVDDYKVLYPYIMNYSLYIDKDTDEEYRRLEQKMVYLLLNYDFTHRDYHDSLTVVRRLESYLKLTDDKEFAIKFNHIIIATLNSDYVVSNPFEMTYFDLLPKYEDVVLNDVLEALAIVPLNKAGFYNHMYLHLGSGLGTGAGPLFQCKVETLKAACLKYPDVLPARLAYMCPVYQRDENNNITGLNEFFIWLISEFSNDKRIVDNFGSNFGSYSWTGVGSMKHFFKHRADILHDFAATTSNAYAKKWAESEAKFNEERSFNEKSHEEWDSRFYS